MKKFMIIPLALMVSGIAQAAVQNPWYFGLRAGGTHYNKFEDQLYGKKEQFKREDFAGGAFIGYQFVPWMGAEIGYTYLGRAKDKLSDGYFQTQGTDFILKFNHRFNDTFDVYSKIGAFLYHTDLTATCACVREKETGVSGTAGAGMEFFFSQDFSTRLEYQYYNHVGKDKAGSLDIHYYGLSFVYGWGANMPILPAIVPTLIPPPEPKPVPAVFMEPLRASLPFGFNSDHLNPQYLAALTPIAQRLRQYPQSKLIVVGHTDSRGSASYNLRLSQERARVTADYLASHFGLSPNRIVVQGDGETRPVATNATSQGRAENRRVEIYTPGFQVQPAGMM